MTYIGEKEVKSIDGTTVTFVDDSTRVFTERQLTYLVTEEPTDATGMQDLLRVNIVPDFCNVLRSNDMTDTTACVLGMLDVIEAHDVRKADLAKVVNEFASYFNKMQIGIEASYQILVREAMGKAFGTYEEGKPFENFEDDIRVSDLKRVKTL